MEKRDAGSEREDDEDDEIGEESGEEETSAQPAGASAGASTENRRSHFRGDYLRFERKVSVSCTMNLLLS